MSSAADTLSLISLNPVETLIFKLERNANAKSILKVTNVSQEKIVFKVKTTQPSWYYVRPNQQILDVGQTEDIAIVLVEAECNRFLDQIANNKAEKLDKHRFLVQCKAITDEEFHKLNEMPAAARTEEYAKLWESTVKDDKKNIKLKVEFKYDDVVPSRSSKSTEKSSSSSATTTSASTSENAESVRKVFERSSSNDSGTAAPTSSTATGATSTMSSQVAEDNAAAYEALKKKYDAVVEYTVHLTAERDNIVSQLEESQRDLSREITKRRASAAGEVTKTMTKDKNVDKKSEQKGFSLTVVLLVAFIFFAVGRYLGASGVAASHNQDAA